MIAVGIDTGRRSRRGVGGSGHGITSRLSLSAVARGPRHLYKFDFAYPLLPYHVKYALFQGRFASSIHRSNGLGLLPSLHQFADDPYLLRLVKDAGRLAIHLNIERLFRARGFFNIFWKRVPVMVGFFTRTNPQVRSADADITDDGCVGGPQVMCFCSAQPDACLMPDHNFIRSNAYANYRRVAAARPDNWSARNDVVLWRGSPSDAGNWSGAMDENEPGLKPRLRMCLLLRDVPKTDVKIQRALRGQNALKVMLEKNRLSGEFVPTENWFERKFALDIDGVSNAWSNLFVRLLLGCCVLKVASPRGFRQWYYDELVPWQHYVPVQSNMSDLLEKIDWCRSHDAQCRDIAAAGQQFALKRTVETETALAVQRLNDRLGGDAQRVRLANPTRA
jgi:hypothetical protein